MQTISTSVTKANAEGHWFDEDTMKGFGTKIAETAYSGNGKFWYFVYTNVKDAPGKYKVVCFRMLGEQSPRKAQFRQVVSDGAGPFKSWKEAKNEAIRRARS